MEESGVKMLFGSFEHQLDEKGRIILPSKLRTALSEKLYIIKGYEGCLSVFCEKDFENYIKKIQELPYNEKLTRDVVRVAMSSVSELIVEKQFRIQLPKEVIERYKISKELTIVGVIDHIEIWNRDKWVEYLALNEQQFDSNSENLLKNE